MQSKVILHMQNETLPPPTPNNRTILEPTLLCLYVHLHVVTGAALDRVQLNFMLICEFYCGLF